MQMQMPLSFQDKVILLETLRSVHIHGLGIPLNSWIKKIYFEMLNLAKIEIIIFLVIKLKTNLGSYNIHPCYANYNLRTKMLNVFDY